VATVLAVEVERELRDLLRSYLAGDGLSVHRVERRDGATCCPRRPLRGGSKSRIATSFRIGEASTLDRDAGMLPTMWTPHGDWRRR
jgi:hypothetical protein